jgi:hypothetical protein
MKLNQIILPQGDTIEEAALVLTLASMWTENLDESEELTEARFKNLLNRLGLSIHKQVGLLDYVRSFTQGIGKIIVAALKKDKAAVKQIATSIKKEDVIDFLLKLDMATMHLVTGPIHFVDAVTGWDLWANVKHAAGTAGSIYSDIKAAIISLKNKITSHLNTEKQKQMLGPLDSLLLMLGVES